jgi:putative RNA 2'-phosphotransferase
MNKSLSKFLSLVLRHKPETIGITLDANGWTDLQELIQKINVKRPSSPISEQDILDVVSNDEKGRYVLSEDGTKIKAAQGHSISVDLELKKEVPPFTLYHGTVEKFLPLIKKDGLLKMNRNHVHLSQDEATAINVGGRRGVPVVLKIAAKRMHNEGHAFFLSENGVWLTEHVPVDYIEL